MTPTTFDRPTRGEMTWAMTAHLSALCLYLGLLLANLLLPYLIWRWKRAHSAFVGAHALAALNFQITVTIAGLAATIIAAVVPFVWLAVVAIFTANIVTIGIAADRAREGHPYRYPVGVHWIRPRP